MQRFLRRPLGTSETPTGLDSRIRRLEDYLLSLGSAISKLTNDSENREPPIVPMPPPGVEELDDLSDVDLNAPTLGQMLVHNGTDWANQSYTGANFGFQQTAPKLAHEGTWAMSSSAYIARPRKSNPHRPMPDAVKKMLAARKRKARR